MAVRITCLLSYALWLGLISSLVTSPARADGGQVLVPSAQGVNLSQAIWLLEDPDGQLSIDQVRSPQWQARFRPWDARRGDVNLGFSPSVWWFRVRLQSADASQSGWILDVPYAYNRLIDFHAPGLPAVLTGHGRPLDSRPLFSRHFAFIALIDEEPQDFYFRVASTYALSFPLRAWQPSAYAREAVIKHLLEALYYGALLALVINALFIGVLSRDIRFAYYALYGTSLNLAMFAGNGWGRVLVWTDSPAFDDSAGSFFALLTTGALLLLVRRLVRPDLHGPRLMDRLMLWGAGAAIALAALMLAGLGNESVTRLLQQGLFAVSVMLVVLVTVSLWTTRHHRFPGKRFFVASWSVVALGVTVATLRIYDWIPTNTLTSYAIQISTALEMLLMSFSLASLVRHERQQRQHAQALMIDILKGQEQRLERAVAERTGALDAAVEREHNTLAEYLRFAALVSHEFRNSLNIISGQSDMLRKQSDTHSVMQRTHIIQQQVVRLANMTDTWLKSDQLLNAQSPPSVEPIDCRTWLPTALARHPQYQDTHPIEGVVGSGADTVWADPQLLEVVLLNLLDNACKYAPPGSPVCVEMLAGSGSASAGLVGLRVTDQGPGIAPELHEKVFERYFRINPESGQSGTGLGLSFVKHIAQQHGGWVELESTPGQGAQFTVWFARRPVR